MVGSLVDGSPLARRQFRRVRALALLLLIGAALGGGCSSDGDAASPGSSSTDARRAEATTSSTLSTEDEIAARYRAFWEARFEANQAPPNPDHPGLREYATGAQLENVIAETTRNRDQGLAFRRAEDSVGTTRVRIGEVQGDEATVRECVVDDGVVYRIATGEVVDDAVSTQNVRATMRRVEGKWKLAAAQLLQEWEGVAGCALAEDF